MDKSPFIKKTIETAEDISLGLTIEFLHDEEGDYRYCWCPLCHQYEVNDCRTDDMVWAGDDKEDMFSLYPSLRTATVV